MYELLMNYELRVYEVLSDVNRWIHLFYRCNKHYLLKHEKIEILIKH
jgi:hypothetical protein